MPLPPSVLKWFKVYCGFLVLIYIFTTLVAVAGFFIPPEELNRGSSEGPPTWLFYLIVALMLLASLIFAGLFSAPFFLKPKPWVWVLDLVLICIGFLSCATIPAAIPLLIYWMKPETKAYFGRVA